MSLLSTEFWKDRNGVWGTLPSNLKGAYSGARCLSSALDSRYPSSFPVKGRKKHWSCLLLGSGVSQLSVAAINTRESNTHLMYKVKRFILSPVMIRQSITVKFLVGDPDDNDHGRVRLLTSPPGSQSEPKKGLGPTTHFRGMPSGDLGSPNGLS